MSEQTNNNGLALVKPEDLSLCGTNVLTAKQLHFLLTPTDPAYVKQRPAKGGGTWTFVPGGYVQKVLNLMFGWDWDFEIANVWQTEAPNPQIVIHGKLIVRTGGHVIVKSQFGNKDIVFENDKDVVDGKSVKKKSNRPLDIGNDYKAAATDALKKCAALLGIAADVYNREDFREVNVDVSDEDKSQFNSAKEEFEKEKTPPTANQYDLNNIQLF